MKKEKYYRVTVTKSATYDIKAASKEMALNIADEYLMERDFDECEIIEIEEFEFEGQKK